MAVAQHRHAQQKRVGRMAELIIGQARSALAEKALGVAALLAGGLPATLIDDKGDSLLIPASHHGHPDTVRTLMVHC